MSSLMSSCRVQEFLAGLNIVSHAREIWTLRRHLVVPLALLFGGATCFWAFPSLTVRVLAVSWYLPLFLPYAALARAMFRPKAPSDGHSHSYGAYIFYSLKCTFLLVAFALPLCFLLLFLIGALKALLFDSPFGAYPGLFGVCFILLRLVWAVLVGLISLWVVVKVLAVATHVQCYIFQGKSVSVALAEGNRLFETHWPYFIGLLLCATTLTILIEVFLKEHKGFSAILGVAIVLILNLLLFSFHKRVAMAPTRR